MVIPAFISSFEVELAKCNGDLPKVASVRFLCLIVRRLLVSSLGVIT